MVTLDNVRDFVVGYRTQNAGSYPPYIEMSELEMKQFLEGTLWFQGSHPERCDTIFGVPVRIVD